MPCQTDPRFESARIFYAVCHDDELFHIDPFKAQYPRDLRAALREEQAGILAQSARASTETVEDGIQEQLILEELEAQHEPDTVPDFIKENNTNT
jgi:hypothetical protein